MESPEEPGSRFAILCQIQRAQHFAWREAVADLGGDAARAVLRMWEVTGRETARSYAKRLDPAQPLAPQVARCIAWSSRCMGEDAVVEEDAGVALVRHRSCPWLAWHQARHLLEEDRRGCDLWFATVVSELNRALSARLRVETLETLPEGAPSCLRRIWQDDPPR
jgi:hypothetical protein